MKNTCALLLIGLAFVTVVFLPSQSRATKLDPLTLGTAHWSQMPVHPYLKKVMDVYTGETLQYQDSRHEYILNFKYLFLDFPRHYMRKQIHYLENQKAPAKLLSDLEIARQWDLEFRHASQQEMSRHINTVQDKGLRWTMTEFKKDQASLQRGYESYSLHVKMHDGEGRDSQRYQEALSADARKGFRPAIEEIINLHAGHFCDMEDSCTIHLPGFDVKLCDDNLGCPEKSQELEYFWRLVADWEGLDIPGPMPTLSSDARETIHQAFMEGILPSSKSWFLKYVEKIR